MTVSETPTPRPYNRRELEERAIRLALEGNWAEAERCNRLLLESDPNDVDALNRLGKALLEMGLYQDARQAYSRALGLDPYNRIARKNLRRLESLIEQQAAAGPARVEREKILPDLFISESGKSAVVPLRGVTNPRLLERLSRGEVVRLEVAQGTVLVKTDAGETLGRLDPRVGRRLAEFIAGGNLYVAAVAEVQPGGAKIFIRETYRHPRMSGRTSFPALEVPQTEVVRPYVRDWGLRLEEALEIGIDEDEDEEEEEEEEEGEEEEYLEGEDLEDVDVESLDDLELGMEEENEGET